MSTKRNDQSISYRKSARAVGDLIFNVGLSDDISRPSPSDDEVAAFVNRSFGNERDQHILLFLLWLNKNQFEAPAGKLLVAA